jgi:hypothetical protein
METTEDMLGGGSYNKDTYIGYLKMKKGGMKVVPGDLDNSIISKRNNILAKLEKVLMGGDKLKEKNIDKYFKALGGKYIRNDMCISGDLAKCKLGKKVSMGGAKKLMDLGSSKYTPELLEHKFKGAAPVLYEKFINRTNNNGNRLSTRKGGYHSDVDYNDNLPYGGSDMELENLRNDIGRYQYFSGGSDVGIKYNDIELNKLRGEIDSIRYN